jgi:hypothetical protein
MTGSAGENVLTCGLATNSVVSLIEEYLANKFTSQYNPIWLHRPACLSVKLSILFTAPFHPPLSLCASFLCYSALITYSHNQGSTGACCHSYNVVSASRTCRRFVLRELFLLDAPQLALLSTLQIGVSRTTQLN